VKRLPPEFVHLSALRAGTDIVATQLGLLQHGHFYNLIVGFEGGDWRKYSPGILAVEEMLAWCHANGVAEADFGIGDEPYKFDYCERHLPLYRVQKSQTAFGLVFVTHQRLMERLRRLALWQRLRPYKWRLLYVFKGRQASTRDAERGNSD
jgi:CelD/BcsL family acetyltransferase involved in cellulose biosynthesis